MSAENKKALIITYYWPPAGGPGVQRILNIVEHLQKFAWEPVILTVKEPSAPAIDESLLKRIPKDIKVYKTVTKEPFNTYKKFTGRQESVLPKNVTLERNPSVKERLSLWVRANLFIPDARKGWKRFMVKEGLKIIDKEQPDVIFSTSPPHSLQVGARKLAQKSGLPWICDLRDPWTEAYWELNMPKTKTSRKKNKRLEKKALDSASHITTVGRGVKELLMQKSNTPVSVIYNGYRELEISLGKTEYFDIVHLGNLSNMQYCETLFNAVDLLPEEKKARLKLTFIGSVAEEHKMQISKILGVKVEYFDFLPYSKMLEKARFASMLLLPKLNSTYSKGLISAKLFDYLALRRPIIAITDPGSDIGEILLKTGSGKSFLPDESPELSHYLREHLLAWGKNEPTIINKTKDLEAYSSIENVRYLADIFKKTTQDC